MTSQELKNSILHLAVQGKLVPQEINDESATELLKRINKYRADAIAEGKLFVDKKHTADVITEDDIPYDLPSSWIWVRFADIVAFNSGKTPARQDITCWSNGIVPWVSIADMVADGITYITKDKVSKQAITNCFAEKISPAGTMIMSFKLTIGKMSILGVDAVHNEAIISIFPTAETRDAEVLKKYLFKILPVIAVMGDSKNAVKGKTLNATSISNLMIPLPPVAEQERIVEKVEELLPYIEKYDKAEKQLQKVNDEFPDKLRKSILQQAVQGKLTERHPDDEPASELLKRIREEKLKLISEGKMKKEKTLPPITDDEKTFEIPNTWEWARLDDVYSVGTGMTPLKSNRSFYENGTIPWITSSLTSNRYIDHAESYITEYALESNSLELYPENTLLIAMYGQGKTRGQISELLISATINQACAALVAFSKRDTLNQYIYFYFQYYYESLRKKAEGSSQPNLNLTKIRECVIPVPPLAEQKRIVARIEEIFAVCDKLE